MPRLTRPEQITRHKATAIEFDKRVETVRQLALSGMQAKAIIRYGSDSWGVTPRMIERYMKRATALNAEMLKFSEAEMLAEHVAHRRDLRKRAQAAGDLKAELATARDEAQLIGLYAAQKMDVTVRTWQEEARKAGATEEQVKALEAAAPEFEQSIDAILTGAVKVKSEGEA